MRDYTGEEQQQLVAALDKLKPSNPLRGAMDDYANLRDQVRACNNP